MTKQSANSNTIRAKLN